MALSTCCKPSIVECFPGNFSALCKWRCNAGERIPEISEDFPEPDTPVIEVKHPKGILTSMLLRLLCCASFISSHLPFGMVLSDGGWIERRPERYAPVTCLLYTSPSPRDAHESRMPSSA